VKPEFTDPVETYPRRTRREIFARYGYTPPPPSALNDRQVPGRLWELLYAAATRRFFICRTNHLSDRELYVVLCEQWFDKETADIPPEAETNTTTIVAQIGATAPPPEDMIWRYYIDEANGKLCRSADPELVLPPLENPPYDRDRFLPVPPVPREAQAGWLPGDPPEDDKTDPLGLYDIGDEMDVAKDEPSSEPDSSDSAFQAQLEAMEPENWVPPARTLAEERIPLLPPAEITDETLTPILWELLHNLELRGFYVLHSDHLSDRELYAELWERGLRDPAHLPGRSLRGGWFHDFLCSWGDDDMQKWLRYYATDEERAKHAKEYPKDNIPPREKPCSNRDWRMPKGPF